MSEGIETRLVYGFLDAGKTSYIRENIRNDYFHKYGTTLILCFEQGEEEYDPTTLAEKRTLVRYYTPEETVGTFCRRCIQEVLPDRIYVEMNTMMTDLPEQLPEEMHITFAVTLLSWKTLPVYFRNFRQMIQRMTAASQQVVFRSCPDKELLSPYSQSFRLMNQRASYLRQDPMGYHERAFDPFLPFSLEEKEIDVTEETYLPFWLDALDHPEHFEGKILRFSDPLELRRTGPAEPWSAGRMVMVCCMADLQFMSFELEVNENDIPEGWIVIDAAAVIGKDEYGRSRLRLRPENIRRAPPPECLILDSSRPNRRDNKE